LSKYISIPLQAHQLKVLLIGEPQRMLQELELLCKKEIQSIVLFPTETNEELKEYVQKNINTSIVEKLVTELDFQEAHIVYDLTENSKPNTEYIKWAQHYKVHIIHSTNGKESSSDTAIEVHKKLILNKVQSEIPGTKEYQDPYDILEYITKYAKSARVKANVYLALIGVLLCVGFFFITIYEFEVYPEIKHFLSQENHIFYWMVLVGFIAEMVAGSMGMGYGVICTTILLLLNVPPPVVSASIHSAESFTSAAGTASHYKLKNINFKLVKALAPFAIIGAIVGSLSLSYFGEHYAHIVKPILAGYTLLIGVNIFVKTITKNRKKKIHRKKSNLPILGSVGGFIDAFVGGGWGPLVTGSLIKDGRTPRYVVGSSTFAKFLLTITSAITFIFTLGTYHWNIVLGLLIGGVITAPFSAMLTAKLPVKKMTIGISILVIVMSSISLFKALF